MSLPSRAPPADAPHPTQYLGFSLADETYALELLRIREIIEHVPITRVPGMPPAVQAALNRALVAEAQRYPGQEREVFEFFRNTPRAIDNIRAPLFEDKVIDFILELAKVDEKTVSVDELVRDPDESEDTAAA